MTLEPVDIAPRRAKWLEIVLFLLTGGVAALVNVVSRFLLNPFLGFVPAVVVAYMIGMLVAYVLFRAVAVGPGRHTIRFEFAPIAGALQELRNKLSAYRAGGTPTQ